MWQPFWALPLTICLTAFALGLALPLADETVAGQLPYVFPGGPDGARDFLGTIASAMISVTGLVFSITLVVLQLASSQFTPRVLGTFLQSRITQVTLGVFTASFVYALTVLRSVRGGYEDTSEFVPQTSVTFAFILVLVAVGMFMSFIHHITTTIQVSQIISRLGEETVDVVSRYFAEPPPQDDAQRNDRHDDTRVDRDTGSSWWRPPPGTPHTEVTSGSRHGHLTQIDYGALWDCAVELDVVVEVLIPTGRFVTEDQAIMTVWGTQELADPTRRALAAAAHLGSDRSIHQDPGYGIRQLLDIGDRALSAGINDPTTAVQVLDELHRVLKVLVRRETPRSVLGQEARFAWSTARRPWPNWSRCRSRRSCTTGWTRCRSPSASAPP